MLEFWVNRTFVDQRLNFAGNSAVGCRFDGCVCVLEDKEVKAAWAKGIPTTITNNVFRDCRFDGDGWLQDPMFKQHITGARDERAVVVAPVPADFPSYNAAIDCRLGRPPRDRWLIIASQLVGWGVVAVLVYYVFFGGTGA